MSDEESIAQVIVAARRKLDGVSWPTMSERYALMADEMRYRSLARRRALYGRKALEAVDPTENTRSDHG